MNKFDSYLFRCHNVGRIMTENSQVTLTKNQEIELNELLVRKNSKDAKPLTGKMQEKLEYLISKRDAKPELSQGVKTHCKNIAKGILFNRNRKIKSKYLEKGIENEEKGFDLWHRVKGEFLVKNRKRIDNDFITGEPDVINETKDIVLDIKNSWDLHSFPLWDTKITNSLYYAQGQGYLDLTGLNVFKLVYCLIDVPIRLIDDELRRLDWTYEIFSAGGEILEKSIPFVVETVNNMIFTEIGLIDYCNHKGLERDWFEDFVEIPPEERLKVFEIQRDQEYIDRMHDQITMCREYMKTLKNEKIFIEA